MPQGTLWWTLLCVATQQVDSKLCPIKSKTTVSVEGGFHFNIVRWRNGRRPRLMFLVDALRRTAAEQLTGSNPVLAANQKNCCIFVLWKRNYLRTQTESSCICSIGLAVVSMTYGHQTKKRLTVVWWMREKIGKRRTRLTVNYVPTTSRCVVVLTHSTKSKTAWVGVCVCNNNGGIA